MRHVGQISLLASLGFVLMFGCAVQENAERASEPAESAGSPTAGSAGAPANIGGQAVGGSSSAMAGSTDQGSGANAGTSGGDAAGGTAAGGTTNGGGASGAGANGGGSGGGSGCAKTEVALLAVADADIRADSSAANDGNTGDIQVRRFGANASWRALVQFDPSSIPAGASIVSANLTLTVAASSGEAKSVGAHRIEPPHWDEMQVTWQVASAKDAWMKPGGDFAAEATALAALPANVSSGAPVGWDVTADVAASMAQPSATLGWLLKDEAEPNAGSGELVAFAARSHGNVTWQPRLNVVYCK